MKYLNPVFAMFMLACGGFPPVEGGQTPTPAPSGGGGQRDNSFNNATLTVRWTAGNSEVDTSRVQIGALYIECASVMFGTALGWEHPYLTVLSSQREISYTVRYPAHQAMPRPGDRCKANIEGRNSQGVPFTPPNWYVGWTTGQNRQEWGWIDFIYQYPSGVSVALRGVVEQNNPSDIREGHNWVTTIPPGS